MPDIKGFEAGNVGLQPQSRGLDAMREAGGVAFRAGRQEAGALQSAGNALGRGVEAIGRGAGEIALTLQQHEDTQATTEAMMKSADFDVQQHQALDHMMDPRPDPNDPTGQTMVTPDPNKAGAMIGQRLEQWKADREALREQITNPKALEHFDRDTAESYKSFATKAYAIGGDLAYKAAGTNIIKSVQSNAALVYDDPTQLDAQLGKLHGTIASISGGLNVSAEHKATFQNELEQKSARALIESAVEGAARKGPAGIQAAENIINDDKYAQWIGTDKDKLLNHLRTVGRNSIADQEAARRLQQQNEKDTALARTDQYIQDANSGDPKLKLNDIWHDPAYANRPDLRREAIGVVETMRKFQTQDAKVNPAVSHSTTLDLISRMTAPEGNPERITDRRAIDQAFTDGTLTRQDYTFLQGQLKNITKEGGENIAKERASFFKAYAPTLDPGRLKSGPSALGNTNIYRMQQDAIHQEQVLKAKGEDPRSLYDPNSPNFIGAPKNLAKYQVSVRDASDYQRGIQHDLEQTLQKYAPGSAALSDPATTTGGSPMDIASKYLGRSETADHAVLTAFLNTVGGPHIDPAKTPWCARWMNAVLGASGRAGTGSDLAKSFLKYGVAVKPEEAKPGDIIVFNRGAPGSIHGHVGFIKAIHGDTVEVLGGNQGNRVSIREFSLASAVGIRRVGASDVGKAIPGEVAPDTENAYAVAKIPADIVSVKSPEDAYKLKPGTRIRLPDGRLGTVPYPQVPISR